MNTPETPEHILKLQNEVSALGIAILTVKSDSVIYVLGRLMEEKEQQLKDAQFEQERNPLPFPENDKQK